MRVTLPEGEVSLVASDISPTGAFFAGVRRLEPGAPIDVLIRPTGLKIAPVRLHAQVVRVVQPGGSFPPGFAVRWVWALSEAGAEPVFQVLRKILHIHGIRDEHFDSGRRVRFDFPAVGARFEFRTLSATSATVEAPPPSLRGNEFREEVVSTGSRVHQAVAMRPRTRPGERIGTSAAEQALPLTSAPAFAVASPVAPTPAFSVAPSATRAVAAAPPARASVEFGTAMELAAAEAQDKTPPNGVDFDMMGVSGPAGVGLPSAKPTLPSGSERIPTGGWSTWRRTSDLSDARRQSDVSASDDLRPVGRRSSQAAAPLLDPPAASPAQRPRRSASDSGAFFEESSLVRPPSVVFDAMPRSNRTSIAPQSDDVGHSFRSRGDAPPSPPSPSRPVSGASPSPHRMPSVRVQGVPPAESGRAQSAPPADSIRRGSDIADSPFLERSQIFGRAGQLTTNFGIDARSTHGNIQAPAMFDLPVTYEFEGRLVPGRLISAASLAVEISTRESVPNLDERLVVNLPVEVEGRWRTVSIHGKMLKNSAPRDDGAQAMIVAIERIQEGTHVGAYARMLRDAQAEAGL